MTASRINSQGTNRSAYSPVSVGSELLRTELLALLLLLVAAIGLRVYMLNAGLWLDEILTYVNYSSLPYKQIITTFDSENQHFLYSLLAHTSFLIFGASAWAVRLPAVIFGVLSLPALYLLGREVTDSKEALLATALLTFSYHHVWFSQNARGYTGLLFWTLFSSWLFIKGLNNKQRSIWIYYAISASLGMYTHLTMVFVIIGQFLIYLVSIFANKEGKGSWIWIGLFYGFIGAGFLTLLLHLPVIPQMAQTIGGSEASVVTEWKNPIWTLKEIIEGLRIGFSSGVAAVAALLLFGSGLVSYWRTRPVVVGLLLIPPVIGAAVTIAVGHHLWPRFFFFAFGFAALVLIRGVMQLGDFLSRLLRVKQERIAWLGITMCVGLIAVSALSVPFAYGPKQDYSGAMNFICSNLQPDDSVVTVSLTAMPYQQYLKTGWEEVNDVAELNTIRQSSNRTWIVYTFPPVLSSVYPEIMESIERDFNLVEIFPGTVGGGEIYVARADFEAQ